MESASRYLIKSADVPSIKHTPGGEVKIFSADQHSAIGNLTVAMCTTPRDGKTRQHRHPYAQLFLIVGGSASFRINDEIMNAEPGDMVVVPPRASHSYVSTGEMPLVHVEIQPTSFPYTEFGD